MKKALEGFPANLAFKNKIKTFLDKMLTFDRLKELLEDTKWYVKENKYKKKVKCKRQC